MELVKSVVGLVKEQAMTHCRFVASDVTEEVRLFAKNVKVLEGQW